MAYCNPDSLLVGSIAVDGDERALYTDIGASEIDAALGFAYEVPIVPIPPATALPTNVAAILEKCNRLISTGRLILARNAAVDDGLHAYGMSLLMEGTGILQSIAGGALDLPGVIEIVPEPIGDGSAAMGIINADSVSGVEAYTRWMHDTSPGIVTPDIWVPYE